MGDRNGRRSPRVLRWILTPDASFTAAWTPSITAENTLRSPSMSPRSGSIVSICSACMATAALATPAQASEPPTDDKDARMAWWRDARFGMFIHWGVYSVPGGEYKGLAPDNIGE